MKRICLPAAAAAAAAVLVLAATPGLAARPLTESEHTALRCATALAVGTTAQARGEGWARVYPPLASRSREFFVRLTAKLMDDAGLDESGIKAAAQAEAAAVRRSGGPAPLMPFCLRLLDAQPGLAPPAR